MDCTVYGLYRSVCSKCSATNTCKPTCAYILLQFAIASALISVLSGQVTITVPPTLTVDSGSSATLSCSYTINESYGHPLHVILWAMGETHQEAFRVADFIGVETITPTYYNNFSPPDYIATRDRANRATTLVIASVNFHNDSGVFWCVPTLADGYEDGKSIELIVVVLPTSITISDETGTYPANGTSYLIEGEERQYTCLVPDINPGATFTWTVGGRSLTPDGKSDITGSNGLTTSSSTTTITAVAGNDGEMLQCQASNKNGHDGVSTTMVLDVRVPPKASMMSLLDFSGHLGDPAVIGEGTRYTFTCRVLSTKPAATIRWFLNGVEQTTTTTSPGGGNGLVDTEGQWTFTPERVNHRQMVKCEANTAESQPPFPFVSTTLNVIGPPDTPAISGSLTMTENVATTLTCAADMGYPEDWVLVWSNEDTAIENPRATTAVLSGTSQRYMFTSQLEFTPQKQDNTHFIKCVGSRPAWTSTPSPEKTWGPILVKYETNITNKHQTKVGTRSGVTANLSCTAKGNPEPVITWFNPNNAEIINGGDEDKYMVVVSYTTSDADMIIGNVTTSKLSIRAVDAMVDYGVYTCNSNNGIGNQDSHEIILNGPRRPNRPNSVVLTDRTSSSIAVRWSAGYDGGEPQWFHVGHKKTADSSDTVSERIDGEVTTYNVTGLESYTEYEVKVYAENDLGRNPSPGSVVKYTLPEAPDPDSGFTMEYNEQGGTVSIEGLKFTGGCIQLDVKYEGVGDWQECGDCITADVTVTLSKWCPRTRKRRRRNAGDIEDLRAKLCFITNGQICSDPTAIKTAKNDPPTSQSTGIIIGVTVGTVFLIVIFFLLGVWLGRKKRIPPKEARLSHLQPKLQHPDGLERDLGAHSVYQEVTEMAIVESANRTYANVISKDKSFQRDMLNIVKELGQGAFGQVFLAEAKGIKERSEVTLVAVKSLKEGASTGDKDDMTRELHLMKKLPDHCNVVKLMGYCVEQDPPYIIVEYLSRGNLKDLLKDSRSKGGRVYGNLHGVSKSLTSGSLVKFANDVADGMNFISSQKCIHRDLAARNVLVAEDWTCKVSDFGLARDVMNIRVYERVSKGRLPLRWMAMESIIDDVYTSKSDVWSFGVLLWEIVTLGARPYPALSTKMMIEELQNGYRMPKPNHCQDELYEMMSRCWNLNPKKRPLFKTLSDDLHKLRHQEKECISIKAYQEAVYEVTIPNSEQEKV